MIKLKLAVIGILGALIVGLGSYAIDLPNPFIKEKVKQEATVVVQSVKPEKEEKVEEETEAVEETVEEPEVKEEVKQETVEEEKEDLPEVEFKLSDTKVESINGEEKVVKVTADKSVEIAAKVIKGTCSIWNEPGYLFIYPSSDSVVEVMGSAEDHESTTQQITVKYTSKDVKKEPEKTQYTITPMNSTMEVAANVNIRKEPDTNSDKLGLFYTGEKVEVIGYASNGFYQVKWNGKEVYVFAEYVKEISQSSDNIVENTPAPETNYGETPVSKWVKIVLNVNVREAADRNSRKLGMLFAGDTIEVTAITNNGFHKVKWNGKEVYIDSEHVGADASQPSAPEQNTNPNPEQTGDLSFYYRGAMSGLQDKFFAYANQYGVDPYLITAIACHETGYGTSDVCVSRNNFGGILTPDYSDYRTFDSVDEGVRYLASLIGWYRDQGRTSIEAIGEWYCNGEQLWIQRVTTIYNAMKS